ncbi:MAG: 30S ribosome-binding factor RbfA [Planctomycetes bacterium]|nr:30S ribosome-binding factor RbfA [Planctomycetota bacterium]
MNPRKKRQIEEMLRRELSAIILYELNDPRAGFLSITGVALSEDRRSAEVRLMVRGESEETSRTLQALSHARGYIQELIGNRLSLRYTPVLSFVEDQAMLRALKIGNLIDKARREDREFRN